MSHNWESLDDLGRIFAPFQVVNELSHCSVVGGYARCCLLIDLVISPIAMPLCIACGMCECPSG